MPYIDTNMRRELRSFCNAPPSTPGELSFVLLGVVQKYLASSDDPPAYRDYSEVVGVLECLKMEFYRRAVAVYEDRKCKENGDVF